MLPPAPGTSQSFVAMIPSVWLNLDISELSSLPPAIREAADNFLTQCNDPTDVVVIHGVPCQNENQAYYE